MAAGICAGGSGKCFGCVGVKEAHFKRPPQASSFGLALQRAEAYDLFMIIVRFPTVEMRRRALAFLLRHFSGKSWSTGEVMVPEAALSPMATEGILFTVEGPATYDRVLRLNQAAGQPLPQSEAAATA